MEYHHHQEIKQMTPAAPTTATAPALVPATAPATATAPSTTIAKAATIAPTFPGKVPLPVPPVTTAPVPPVTTVATPIQKPVIKLPAPNPANVTQKAKSVKFVGGSRRSASRIRFHSRTKKHVRFGSNTTRLF
jgi:hypothetical protein